MLIPQHLHPFVGIHPIHLGKGDLFDGDDVDRDAALFANLAVEEVIVLLTFHNIGLPGGIGYMIFKAGCSSLVLGFDFGSNRPPHRLPKHLPILINKLPSLLHIRRTLKQPLQSQLLIVLQSTQMIVRPISLRLRLVNLLHHPGAIGLLPGNVRLERSHLRLRLFQRLFHLLSGRKVPPLSLDLLQTQPFLLHGPLGISPLGLNDIVLIDLIVNLIGIPIRLGYTIVHRFRILLGFRFQRFDPASVARRLRLGFGVFLRQRTEGALRLLLLLFELLARFLGGLGLLALVVEDEPGALLLQQVEAFDVRLSLFHELLLALQPLVFLR
mmetsp:Transcript_28279/g.59737  ORF Transcript_28279/g.59737 Transcript_28279/m.59737 type:complete len:326 (+) Transcript_28279:1911-2888(+)